VWKKPSCRLAETNHLQARKWPLSTIPLRTLFVAFPLRRLSPLAALHAFRHFAASMMDRLNAPLKLREHRLRHSDAAMTLGVYSHVAEEDDVRIAAHLGEILAPSGPFQKNEGPAPHRQAIVN
jgi:integrase